MLQVWEYGPTLANLINEIVIYASLINVVLDMKSVSEAQKAHSLIQDVL